MATKPMGAHARPKKNIFLHLRVCFRFLLFLFMLSTLGRAEFDDVWWREFDGNSNVIVKKVIHWHAKALKIGETHEELFKVSSKYLEKYCLIMHSD